MEKKARDHVVLFINGQSHQIKGQYAFMTLARFLRYELGLTGTKIVCGEGDCGACTVLCHRAYETENSAFFPINACIVMVAQLDGCHILTVEGEHPSLSMVQEAIVKAHGSQCGFCTPGFVMALAGLLEKPDRTFTEQKVKNALTGNLCRCTGYQPLITAALSIDKSKISALGSHFLNHEKELKEILFSPVFLKYDSCEFIAPLTIVDVIEGKSSRPGLQIIAGATDMGVAVNKGKTSLTTIMSLHLIPGLDDIVEKDDRIIVAARVTLSKLRQAVKKSLPELARFLNIFASPQIKNIATLVGNVANASPIGDTLPFLLVADGAVHVQGKNGKRVIDIVKFFQGYRITAMAADEVITHISFAQPKPTERLRLHKVSQRKDLDISTVSTAFLFNIEQGSSIIDTVKLAVGGVHGTALRLKKAESVLVGHALTPMLIEQAAKLIQEEITPLSDLRGTLSYRRVVVDHLFRRYCDEIQRFTG